MTLPRIVSDEGVQHQIHQPFWANAVWTGYHACPPPFWPPSHQRGAFLQLIANLRRSRNPLHEFWGSSGVEVGNYRPEPLKLVGYFWRPRTPDLARLSHPNGMAVRRWAPQCSGARNAQCFSDTYRTRKQKGPGRQTGPYVTYWYIGWIWLRGTAPNGFEACHWACLIPSPPNWRK